MPLELYNTLTREKTPFVPITPGRVGMYSCGPTVYSEPHLGHARGPIIFDVLKRWLQHLGYQVRLVSNVTDVGHLTDDADEGEDKLAKRAKLEKLEPMEIAEKYFWSYYDAMAKLGVKRPDIVPKASGHIIEQIEMIQDLIKRSLAYERDGSVYFDVSEWKTYGELSGRDVDEQVEGTRVAIRSDKDDSRDFALWKRAEPEHIMRWNSPWGEGFPGWHIECSVMSTKYLGDEFDIHGGGLDLIFPHHECEIAQARGAGKNFARTWIHWNMITLEGEKMAKSKNHFVTLNELFDDYDPLIIRFHLLRSHYRSISDFSKESLLASQQGLKRLVETYQEVLRKHNGNVESKTNVLEKYHRQFSDAMNDDLNTPEAIAALFDATREINTHIASKPTQEFLSEARALYETFLGQILGVLDEKPKAGVSTELLDGLIQMIIEQRQEARARRDFKTSDALRDRLTALGVTLEDTAEGSRWKLS